MGLTPGGRTALSWLLGGHAAIRSGLKDVNNQIQASPRRPIVTASQYEALLAAASQIHPLFSLALILAHETGHRIGAVGQVRWADIDFERQLIRWRGENDKIGYEHETWLTPDAVEALRAAGRSQAIQLKNGSYFRGPARRLVQFALVAQGYGLTRPRPRLYDEEVAITVKPYCLTRPQRVHLAEKG